MAVGGTATPSALLELLPQFPNNFGATKIGSDGLVRVAAGVSRLIARDLQFVMLDASGSPVAGLSDGDFTAKQVSLDGDAFVNLTNAIDEVGHGLYTLTLEDSELDGQAATFRFVAAGTLELMFTILTNPTA